MRSPPRKSARPSSVAAFLLIATALPGGTAAQASPLEGLDEYIEQAMVDWEVPGLAVAVVKDDSVVYSRGFGVTELGGTVPVDEHTLFAIASTTKAFTTAALAMLVDEGRLDWDDPVTLHLPEFQLRDPFVTRELTVRDLVTHRVGVARYDNVWIAAPFERDEILRRARHLPTAASFRDRYGYN
ncbi:MAG TPA: class A beta-lactamase-related serine hydrolase, partial [Alphaproteobacteria bacterium]|nr:class A beta-lactamase-related serine hydrolase [Alphaproteobacteria bacterium]